MNKNNLLTALAALVLAACGGTVREDASAELEIVDGDLLDFPGTLAGTTRTRRVTLSNGSGGSEFDPLDDIRIGVDGEGLQVTHDCPASLKSKEGCTIRVTAAPRIAGTLAGTLRVDSSDGTRRRSITGSAVAAFDPVAPAFGWQTGASGAFGAVDTGETLTRSIGIVNRGNAAGRVTVRLAPTGAPWTLTSDCARVIGAGESCTATLVFAPTEAQAYETALEIVDTYRSGYAPERLEVTGTGL